ncbi:hypothetical protein MLD38_036497 [Melastoma candidum]|uniref:Uncharacterized protein n=1 Tax=Melastoma candidum TaxID=119954 RepID=A0ACB9LLQ5_9MYRT|nr:hypothetical protein MLD38_036497 [Melastoma candidum]
MKCFYFRDKSKSKQSDRRQPNSAPALQNHGGGGETPPEPRGGGDRAVPGLSGKTRSMSALPSPSSLPSPRRGVAELYREKRAQGGLREFSYRELRDATCGFNRALKIGEGGFGSVYKGTIKVVGGDPTVVAIKRLNQHGLQGRKEWMAEVQFLSVVEHPHLVKLLGYCSAENERGPQLFLVYEYMPNRGLDDHLFNQALPVLPWKTRLEIILGAAEGLAYLHEGMEIKVIYRDFKSANVLLDENFQAKLSDFGLAREGPVDDRSHVTTVVVGTYGYAAPEYVETGHLTIHSDVWTFGIVLYEILTGRRAVERNRPSREQKLLDWVKDYPVDGKTFSMIIDPRLRGQYSYPAARRIGKLAERCLVKNAKDRPTMREVTLALKQAILESQPEASDSRSSGSRPATKERRVPRRTK